MKRSLLYLLFVVALLLGNVNSALADGYVGNTPLEPRLELTQPQQALVSKNTTYKVLCNPDSAPYYEFIDGKPVGIVANIMQLISARTGIKAYYIPVKSYEEYQSILSSGDYDIRLDAVADPQLYDNDHELYTKGYLDIAYAKISLRTAKLGATKVGAISGYAPLVSYLKQFYYPEQLVFYSNREKCIEALGKGECSDLVVNSWAAEKFVNDDIRNKYVKKELPGKAVTLALAVNKRNSPELVGILNKGLDSLNETKLQSIVGFYTRYTEPKMTLVDYAYTNPLVVAGALILLGLITLISAIAIMVVRKRHQEQRYNVVLQAALKEARSAGEAKTAFLSTMSHEIRTPLNAVIGYTSMAQEDVNDTDKLKDCLNKTQLAAKHLLAVINDVLDISAINTGKLTIAKESFDFKNLVNGLTAMFYQQAKKKGVHFSIDINRLNHEFLKGDELRVNQVLLNLLSNAVKFTPAGKSVVLKIDQELLENKQVQVTFEVVDTGIGMKPEYMKRLFNPFEQQDATITRKYGGSGLGLSITKKLVDMMQGTIQVTSEEGKGTSFRVVLPFEEGERVATEPVAAETDFSKLRALIVDDEPSACEYMQSLLKRCGVKSDCVNSGIKAVKRIERRLNSDYPYDLCLLDWNMPEMDGIETARRIREICGKDLPIIIASAYDYSDVTEEAMKIGVDKIISKPLFQSTVFDLLVNTYGKYHPKEAKDQEKIRFDGLHLLLAEDNAMNMEIAVDILTKAGLIIDQVTDGKQALDKFEAAAPGTYQAILMDIQMPVMDGYEATRAIRQSSHPEAKTMPIIAMTANAFSEDVDNALAAGMNAHIAKPISYDRLFGVLKKILKPTSSGAEGSAPMEQANN